MAQANANAGACGSSAGFLCGLSRGSMDTMAARTCSNNHHDKDHPQTRAYLPSCATPSCRSNTGKSSILFINHTPATAARHWTHGRVLVAAFASLAVLAITTFAGVHPPSCPEAVSVNPSLEHVHLIVRPQVILCLIANMVSSLWGGLTARAAFIISSHRNNSNFHIGTSTGSALSTWSSSSSTYTAHSLSAAKALQGWYNEGTGLWDTAGWWNSANCLTVLADWAALDSTDSNTLSVTSIISNTYANAQKTTTTASKMVDLKTGFVTSSYATRKRSELSTREESELAKRGFSGFINDYYDDEGWWALALIRSWDLTKEDSYLTMAEEIFADMQNGTDSTCGGGIWWSKDKNYKNAIANELYLAVAANLANRVSSSAQTYANIAVNQWKWFKASGMINSKNNINDGLTILSNGTCVNNGLNPWSYNQGVVLGGLTELAKYTKTNSYFDEATTIALSAISLLQDANGTLHEWCEPNCGGDGNQFKGIFTRNLQYLYKAMPNPEQAIRTSILTNADSIWQNDRNSQNQLGEVWSGPANYGGVPNATTHSSAMDTLVAAIAVV